MNKILARVYDSTKWHQLAWKLVNTKFIHFFHHLVICALHASVNLFYYFISISLHLAILVRFALAWYLLFVLFIYLFYTSAFGCHYYQAVIFNQICIIFTYWWICLWQTHKKTNQRKCNEQKKHLIVKKRFYLYRFSFISLVFEFSFSPFWRCVLFGKRSSAESERRNFII